MGAGSKAFPAVGLCLASDTRMRGVDIEKLTVDRRPSRPRMPSGRLPWSTLVWSPVWRGQTCVSVLRCFAIRYMSYASTSRKFDSASHIERMRTLGEEVRV
jgi:hypothetical protein